MRTPKDPAASPVAEKNSPVRRKRVRLDPQSREEMILKGATVYFAEHGFGSHTKDLAKTLGVSQGLIFRYFGTKQNLIECVYKNVFLQRWSSTWIAELENRERPLKERLVEFYHSYFQAVDDTEWIRVSLHASLSGSDIINRYVRDNVDRVLKVIVREVRFYKGIAPESAVDPIEFEIVWHLHSSFIYALIRKYVHHTWIHHDAKAMVEAVVGNFINGIGPDRSGRQG